MAGTLTISTLSDGTNSTSSTNCIQGSAKTWVAYNANTQSIRSSYNVSSVTYNSTGNYNINFTNAFANANYCVNSCCNPGNYTSGGAVVLYGPDNSSTTTASSCKITCYTAGGGSAVNIDQIYVSFFA